MLLDSFASRKATFFASILSTCCLMALVIGLPLMHVHVQRITSIMLSQVDLCKVCFSLSPSPLTTHPHHTTPSPLPSRPSPRTSGNRWLSPDPVTSSRPNVKLHTATMEQLPVAPVVPVLKDLRVHEVQQVKTARTARTARLDDQDSTASTASTCQLHLQVPMPVRSVL